MLDCLTLREPLIRQQSTVGADTRKAELYLHAPPWIQEPFTNPITYFLVIQQHVEAGVQDMGFTAMGLNAEWTTHVNSVLSVHL